MPRDARRHLLTQLLNAGSVRTQEELATALADAGEAATQATVSRDLAAIGAVRGPGGYSLPGGFTPSAPVFGAPLETALQRHLFTRTIAGTMVVLRTAPGHASLLASKLDATPPEGMVGCIAGDDTILSPPPPPPRPSPWCVPLTPCKKAWLYEHALPRNPRLGLG
ncbi:MAG: arginine repressor [Planctomycetota bacterium]|nr:arginine repressor [Planctomycetota bacterium]